MDMNQVARHSTTISVESKVSASALFEKAREVVHIDPSLEQVDYGTEMYFRNDDTLPVQISIEFGEDDGRKPLFEEDDEDDYVNPHIPYAELSLSTSAEYVSELGGTAKDLHAAILLELSEWFDDHSIEWGYYSDADKSGRWISGETPTRFGNPEKAALDSLAVSGDS